MLTTTKHCDITHKHKNTFTPPPTVLYAIRELQNRLLLSGDDTEQGIESKCSSWEIIRTYAYSTLLGNFTHCPGCYFTVFGGKVTGDTAYYLLLLSRFVTKLSRSIVQWECRSSQILGSPSFSQKRQPGDPGTASVTTSGSILDFQPPLTMSTGVCAQCAPLVCGCLSLTESTHHW